ncbi:hypothetical protein R3P38DRAFT_2584272 [Favolaschia claudopus]|uniref:C2H2-type domain-containing protein n=1 Tax=Favolaschia claudopus TaxID=2862362 RepID=A0AAV9Z8D9_9AGAR
MTPQFLTQSIDGPAPAGYRNAAMTIPVLVPNLIKKSGGSHVPVGKGGKGGGGEQKMAFVREVAGCGKGFVRGQFEEGCERIIHTHEKRESSRCGKIFSRRDNLAQHARVHLPG